MSLNRVVVLISPVFVALAGWAAEIAARYMPGHPSLDKAQLAAVFIAGASFGGAHLLMWLRGHHILLAASAWETGPEPEAPPSDPPSLADPSLDDPDPNIVVGGEPLEQHVDLA